MNSAYKLLDENDKATTRTLLHEAVPITGTIVSGTYGTFPNNDNVKNYNHGMFQSIYDYPYLSSSANHIFDLTVAVGAGSGLYANVTSQKSKKKNIYNQMAQVLVGYDVTGGILQFDQDGDFAAGGQKYDDGYFINLARLLTKDEIKKETFELTLGATQAYATPFTKTVKLVDLSASTEYRVNSPVGDYGILYATSSDGIFNASAVDSNGYAKAGLIYYQAGVVFVSKNLFTTGSGSSALPGLLTSSHGNIHLDSSNNDIDVTLKTIEISGAANAFRHRMKNLQFNNTTEINSTIYFCRANHNEFNYSSNPTYLSSSKMVVKNESTDLPVSYVTTVGLYNSKQELLAVAKLSECLRKDPSTEFVLRVRVDY